MLTTRLQISKITILKNLLYKRLKKTQKIKLRFMMKNILFVFLTLKTRFY
jgi:hypothetical protein